MIQKQFAPAGGASFTPAMPVGHNVAPQTKIDIEPIMKGIGSFINNARNTAFQQGQIDKMANAYEQGKYWYLGDAYKNGAQYAVAQNDIAQAKVDIQKILNEGLARGQDSEETMRKVQERTAKVMGLVDSFQSKFPEAANMLKQQVKAIQTESITSYAVGEYAKFIRNSQTGDQLAMVNSLQDALGKVPYGPNGYDPKQLFGAMQDQYRTVVTNATRRGSNDPEGQAASYLLGAFQATLAGVQLDDPQAVAIVNSMQGFAQQMLSNGMLSIDDYTKTVNSNVNKINQARNYYIGYIEAATLNPTGSKEQRQMVAQRLYALRLSGVDEGSLAKLDYKYKTALNELELPKSIANGTASVTPANFSKFKKYSQDKNKNDKAGYAIDMCGLVLTQGSYEAANEAGTAFNDLVNTVLSASTESGVTSDPNKFGFLVSQLLPNGNPILSEAIRRKLDPDNLDFLTANASSILTQIQAGTFNQGTLQDRFQNFKSNKGGFNPKEQNMDWPGVSWFDVQLLDYGLNQNLEQQLTNYVIRSTSTIGANLSRLGYGFTASGEQVDRLKQLGFVSFTPGDYMLAGDTPVDEYFKGIGEPVVVRQALQNLMKTHFTVNGSKYTTSNDQVFAWIDSRNGRIIINREDKYGSNNSILSYSDLIKQVGKVKSYRDRLGTPKPLGAFGAWSAAHPVYLKNSPAVPPSAIETQEATPSTTSTALDLEKDKWAVYGGELPKASATEEAKPMEYTLDSTVYGGDLPDASKSNMVYTPDSVMYSAKPMVTNVIDYTLGADNGQSNERTVFDLYGQKIQTSLKEMKDFSDYVARRMNGTLNTGYSAYRAIMDTKQRIQLKNFVNSDVFDFFPNMNWFRDTILQYFPEYRQQKKNAMDQEAQGAFANQVPSAEQIKENTMKALEEIKANDGRGGINTYYLTDTVTLGALGPNLGPKVAKSLADMQGFILKPRVTNPKATDKAVVGTGYDYGYPRFNAMVRAAEGDPQKMSQAMNKVYLWWFDTVPNEFQRVTGLDFMTMRDDARLEATFLGATDFMWHSGKNNATYWNCLNAMTHGDFDSAYTGLARSQAYRESGPERKALLFNGLRAYQAFIKGVPVQTLK